jgi:hypothetical protein
MKAAAGFNTASRYALTFFLLTLFVPSKVSLAGDVRLAWNPNTDTELAGYRLCYGMASGQCESLIDVGNVTTYLISGLAPGTYYFKVKAYGRSGEESDFSNEASAFLAADPDTQPPIISNVKSLNISAIDATIVWTTNEICNSQIEYGTTPGYGNITSLNMDLAISHSQVLNNLLPGTNYHFRIKARDVAGNLALSADYIFATRQIDGENPSITNISVTDITNKSATISWSTDTPADSEVHYWIEGSAAKKAAIRSLGTSHSLILNHLQRLTQYHFRVLATNEAGYQMVSPEITFSTTYYNATVLALPRFFAGQSASDKDTAIGIAITNPDPLPDALTFTAMEDNGNPMAGPGITNIVTKNMGSLSQFAILDWQIFGTGYQNSDSNGWIKLDSANGASNGFFLIFDSNLTFLDGTNLSDSAVTDFAFTEIQADNGNNKIGIINTNAGNAAADIYLIAADGTVRSTQSRIIPGNGALTADLFGDLFDGIEPDAGNYILVRSNKGVRPFQLMQQSAGDISALAGQDIAVGETILYSPQYVQGNSYQTSLSIINLDSIPGTINLRFLREDGIQMGPTKTLSIPANGKLHIEDPGFFLPLNPSVTTSGYIEVVSDGIRLLGSTVFGDRNRSSFITALPLISELSKTVLFSHVASSDLYFTGLAILNPNESEAVVSIELYASNGILMNKGTELIGPRKRKANLLTQFFPSLEGKTQTSGYIKLSSNIPIASFAMFGTQTLSGLSAIPPQAIQ